eukprot:gb/GECH01010474.1/.p1 GENE.gb/GECH01010474.1/~~gb/GECH01010474.1/.p1  ORF type:complete len:361 (+),score=14.79 gb/GECH01010474.1/:1-1083(+)
MVPHIKMCLEIIEEKLRSNNGTLIFINNNKCLLVLNGFYLAPVATDQLHAVGESSQFHPHEKVPGNVFAFTLFYDKKMFRELTGLHIHESNSLLEKVSVFLGSSNFTSSRKKFDGKLQLLMCIFWMRQYPVERMIAWIFGCSVSMVYRYTRSTLIALDRVLNPLVNMKTYHCRKQNGVMLGNACVTIIVDCSEQRIKRSIDTRIERSYYSGKQGYTTLSVYLSCSPSGYIYFLSPSYQGSMNDMMIADLSENKFFSELSDTEYIVGDSGFNGLTRNWKNTIIPFKGKNQTAEQKNFNQSLSKIRIGVENVFGHIEDWKICGSTYRSHSSNVGTLHEEHNRIWRVCCGIFNSFKAPLGYSE